MRRSSVRGKLYRGKDRTKRQFKVRCPPTAYSLFLFGSTPATRQLVRVEDWRQLGRQQKNRGHLPLYFFYGWG
jgi:hypothetical protein